MEARTGSYDDVKCFLIKVQKNAIRHNEGVKLSLSQNRIAFAISALFLIEMAGRRTRVFLASELQLYFA